MGFDRQKQYLGDGVYVERREDNSLVLTTENGVRTTNAIYLEPEVYGALVSYVSRSDWLKIPGKGMTHG